MPAIVGRRRDSHDIPRTTTPFDGFVPPRDDGALRLSAQIHRLATCTRSIAGPELGFASRVLIASLSFDVRPEKRGEFVSAVNHLLQTIRWTAGCLGCRLLNDCENPSVFTLSSEWDSRAFLDTYLASPEFQILEGTRYLLRDGPGLSIDEVVARGRVPGPVRTLG